MARTIEILENTLIKMVLRQGTNADRVRIVPSEGEAIYTIDTKRLYVGDGSTVGGIVAGNKFLGTNADITTYSGTAVLNDLAATSDGDLCALTANTGSVITDWTVIATKGSSFSVGADTFDGQTTYSGLSSATDGVVNLAVLTQDYLKSTKNYAIFVVLNGAATINADSATVSIQYTMNNNPSWTEAHTIQTFNAGSDTIPLNISTMFTFTPPDTGNYRFRAVSSDVTKIKLGDLHVAILQLV